MRTHQAAIAMLLIYSASAQERFLVDDNTMTPVYPATIDKLCADGIRGCIWPDDNTMTPTDPSTIDKLCEEGTLGCIKPDFPLRI